MANPHNKDALSGSTTRQDMVSLPELSAGASEDIFVHHSALTTEKDQFRYLVEGEYVTFSVSTTSDKTTASNVTGPDGGKLMCETPQRREQNDERRAARPSNESSESSYENFCIRGGGPRSGQTNERILVQMADQMMVLFGS